jgi:hypothetical protein
VSAENVFGSKAYNHHLVKGPIVGLEYNGEDCIPKCNDIVKELGTNLSKNSIIRTFKKFAHLNKLNLKSMSAKTRLA